MKFYDREKELGILQNQSNRTRGKDFYVEQGIVKICHNPDRNFNGGYVIKTKYGNRRCKGDFM